jgi:hypothetical protein
MADDDETVDWSKAKPRPSVNLELNLNAVIAPAQNAVVLSSEIVDFFSDAIAKADLSKKPVNTATQYKFKTPDVSAADRQAMFENWIFSKAFQDLMRGLKASLEQAYFLLELLAKPQKIKSDATLEEFLAPFRRKAALLHFGPLLDLVNSRLDPPLNFVDAYHSLQRARNCMEHRDGIVGDVDAPSGGVMILSFPRVKNFYMRKGEEIELEAGHAINAEDGNETVQILTKLELRERRFSRCHRLSISINDFNEIAFACNYFAGQLAEKIAAVPPPAKPAA